MGLNGLTKVQELTRLPIVILTGSGEEGLGRQAIRNGALDFMQKDELTTSVLFKTIEYNVERNSFF